MYIESRDHYAKCIHITFRLDNYLRSVRKNSKKKFFSMDDTCRVLDGEAVEIQTLSIPLSVNEIPLNLEKWVRKDDFEALFAKAIDINFPNSDLIGLQGAKVETKLNKLNQVYLNLSIFGYFEEIKNDDDCRNDLLCCD